MPTELFSFSCCDRVSRFALNYSSPITESFFFFFGVNALFDVKLPVYKNDKKKEKIKIKKNGKTRRETTDKLVIKLAEKKKRRMTYVLCLGEERESK